MPLIPAQASAAGATTCVFLAVILVAAPDAAAQATEPFAITDNSFLVEEAFNQEPGIFQNILTVRRANNGAWENGFTQEWPLFTQRHQISYTVPFGSSAGASGVGDAFVHYRLQVFDGSNARPAFSPRVSLILPTASDGLGSKSFGWEFNLPFSKQVGDVFLHWNAGATHLPAADIEGQEYNLLTPRVAGSAIWRVQRMLNLMLESVIDWEEGVVDGQTTRRTTVTLVPGFRTGWDTGDDTQLVVGLGLPVTFRDHGDSAGVLVYFSYELPFVRK
jgi:hypothetical protein